MNTERWTAWVALLKQSDATLVQLATMAAAAVLIWEMLRRVPDRWRELARSLYLGGLLILFAYLSGGQMYFVIAAIVLAAVFVGCGAWLTWTARRVEAEEENSTMEIQETN